MSVPWQPAQEARGLLLVRGEPGPVPALGAPRAGRLPGRPARAWTAVAADRAVVAGRAALRRRRHPARRRGRVPPTAARRARVLHRATAGRGDGTGARAGAPRSRWLVWEPGAGCVRTPALEAGPTDRTSSAAAGAPGGRARPVAERRGQPRRRRRPGHRRPAVGPRAAGRRPGRARRSGCVARSWRRPRRRWRRFDARMAEQARHRTELEENS